MIDQSARKTEESVNQLPHLGGFVGKPRAHAVVYLGDRSFFVNLEGERPVVIGRSEEADVQLPTPTVSRRHFVLHWSNSQLSVQDCGSTNGTYVNGDLLKGEVELKAGDQISAGDAFVVVGVTSPQPLLQRVSPAEAFETRLGHELLRASRLGRTLALVRARFDGTPELAVKGLASLLAHLPGRPITRALGPTDYHVLVDEAVETVRGLCASLSENSLSSSPRLSFGVALFPRDGQDMESFVAAADAALDPILGKGLTAQSGGPIAVDPTSVRVFSLVDRVAASDGTVLLIGETGVGKEVVAREIHKRSGRAKGPFVPVNCGAIPSSMLARELFGHERGAFTGAEGRRSGFFEAASRGTLFLDEIGEIPLADQANLLRAIEERSITRLGGTQQIGVDIRIIAATNRELSDLVQQGRFRKDLLYRLDVLSILIPALRDRPADIEPLAMRFLSEVRGSQYDVSLSQGVLAVLGQHGWPGNVRELRNVIERLALLATGPVVEEMEAVDVLYGRSLTGVDLYLDTDLKSLLASVERAAIERALRACSNNQTLAAERLGISRRTLIYRMQSHGIPGPRSSG